MCQSLHVAVNKSINWCFVHLYSLFVCWWSIINHLLSTAMKTLNLKYFGVTILTFKSHVTSSERDRQTRRWHFSIGGQWWPCVYLARIGRYGASKILVSRVWFFGVTWCHRDVTWPLDSAYVVSYWWSTVTMHLSCTVTEILGLKDIGVMTLTFWGHVTLSITLPSDTAWALSYWWSMMTMRYLARIRRYVASKILGSRVWPFGVMWRHRSRDHWTLHMWFPIGGPLEPCVYLAPLRRYKASNLHLPMLKAESSVRMLCVTWPVGRGFKMTSYLEFPSSYCLFTI